MPLEHINKEEFNHLDQATQNVLIKAFTYIHQRFDTFKRLLIIFGGIVALGCALGIFEVNRIQTDATSQFCRLSIVRYNDKYAQYTQTIDYFKTPTGNEKTGLNQYIRKISFPRLVKELQQEHPEIPSVCTSNTDVKLKPSPKG